MWEDFDWRYEPPDRLKGKPVNDALVAELGRMMDAVASAQSGSQDAAWTMGQVSGVLFLHAVRTGDIKQIEHLARLGVDLNPSDRYGRSSLHLAPNDEVGLALIRLGAEANLIDNVYRTPLHYAAVRGMTRTVKWLLAEALPPDIPDAYGHTAMEFAAYQGVLSTTMLLLEAGADPHRRDRCGDRCLRFCDISLEEERIMEEAIRAWKPPAGEALAPQLVRPL